MLFILTRSEPPMSKICAWESRYRDRDLTESCKAFHDDNHTFDKSDHSMSTTTSDTTPQFITQVDTNGHTNIQKCDEQE